MFYIYALKSIPIENTLYYIFKPPLKHERKYLYFYWHSLRRIFVLLLFWWCLLSNVFLFYFHSLLYIWCSLLLILYLYIHIHTYTQLCYYIMCSLFLILFRDKNNTAFVYQLNVLFLIFYFQIWIVVHTLPRA